MSRATIAARLFAGTLAAALIPAAAAAQIGDREPVGYTVLDGSAIPAALSEPGDAERGAAIAADPALGGCVTCHAITGHDAPESAAPDLAGVGARLPEGRLRLMVVNYAIVDPEIADHAWYEVRDIGETPDEAEVGATRLTAQQIEDLVEWLRSLRD